MRIRYKVALVGGIPIAIAAAIALVAWILLDRAERAQSGALAAGAVYRDLVEVVGAQESFVRVQPSERGAQSRRFEEAAARVVEGLGELDRIVGPPDGPARVRTGLERYMASMDELRAVTLGSDDLVAQITARTAALVRLTDRARARQHGSNLDIMATVGEGEAKLRLTRDIVAAAQEVRALALSLRAERAGGPGPAGGASLTRTRLRNAVDDLAGLLQTANRPTAIAELRRLLPGSIRGRLRAARHGRTRSPGSSPRSSGPGRA